MPCVDGRIKNAMKFVLASIALAVALGGCSSDSFIEKIVIDNPTAYRANVDVRSSEQDAWLQLTAVAPRSEMVVEQVHDQGPTWIFRFSYSDYEEELSVPRSDLAGDGWRVTIPSSFSDELERRGVQPPP